MQGKRRLWGVMFLITALIITQLPVAEADAAASASNFQIQGSTLVKYVGSETTVTVPNTVDTIGESAFEDNDVISKVILPDSVTTIQAYAFWGCDQLQTVSLGRKIMEVDDYAFTNCKGLRTMVLPSNIQYIGIMAFADCVNMTDITIPPEVTNIHETAFDGCYQVVIHAETGSYADKYARRLYEKQLEMPEYEDVPDYPGMEDEELSEENGEDEGVEVPQEGNILGSTKVVGNMAVVFIDNTSPSVLDASMMQQKPEEDTSADASMEDMNVSVREGLPKYTIVDGKIVADQAYYLNNTLGEVALPEGIEEVGQFSFARSSLTGIFLPESIQTIGYGAFYHCNDLAQVTLPQSVETVEPKAFTHTLWMKEFLQSEENFLVSGNVLVAYKGQETQVVLPEQVTVIAAEAFAGNSAIEKIVLPDSLEIIGEGAFEDCENLQEIIWAGVGRVRKIKDRAFANCNLQAVQLSASLTELGLLAFDEETQVVFEGAEPLRTHELSAERLSNESYRNPPAAVGENGVKVLGVAGGVAKLEGATRKYTLQITDEVSAEGQAVMEAAFIRSQQESYPGNGVLYDLQLTDESLIPITKLGKQKLTVVLPLSDELAGENIKVAALDRNGQLELLTAERVLMSEEQGTVEAGEVSGTQMIRFSTTHLSCFYIYGDGTPYQGEPVVEAQTEFYSGSARVDVGAVSNTTLGQLRTLLVPLKWMAGVAVFLMGISCLFGKRTGRTKGSR